MRTVEIERLTPEAQRLIPSQRDEKVVVTRGGKPVALLTAVENLDEEDLSYIESPAFWKMIAERRKHNRISLAEAQARLQKREASEKEG